MFSHLLRFTVGFTADILKSISQDIRSKAMGIYGKRKV